MNADPSLTPGAESSSAGHFLTVLVGGELFAISIARIREVIHCPRLTLLPLSPPAVPGVINLRGAVVAVVDLSARLGRRPISIERRTCIVVVEVQMDDGLVPVGFLVDAVEEAIETTPDMIEPRPAFGSGFRADFLAALIRRGSRFVNVLDMTAVAAASELEQLVTRHSRTCLRQAAQLVS